ncbi:unnamed protein product [Mytilus edulis]|uniref:Uncharacterized protein n=1 Tax=Mytilus edulis TaxID=6550 RepID=A0A8S3VM08_MYTED|nr:unnamed protein product [Mytilus edulis]
MTDTLSPSVASMLGQVTEDGDSIITSLKTELLDVDVDVGIYVDQVDSGMRITGQLDDWCPSPDEVMSGHLFIAVNIVDRVLDVMQASRDYLQLRDNYNSNCFETCKQSRALARCVLELSLQDYDLSQRRPSMLSLCVWKIAVEETKSDDGDYLPGLFHSCEDFEFIYKEVKTFSENLLHNLPDVSRVCEHYYRLYGIE